MIELHQRVEKFTFDFYITIIEKIYEREEEDKNMLDFRTETFLTLQKQPEDCISHSRRYHSIYISLRKNMTPGYFLIIINSFI